MKTCLLLFVASLALLAQFPGRGSRKTPEEKQAQAPRTYRGVIRALDAKSLDIEADDTRMLTIALSEKTTKPADLNIGDGVDVEATQDKDGLFHALTIRANAEVARKILGHAPAEPGHQTSEPQAEAPPTPSVIVRQGPLYDDDDSGPPKLKRGIPAEVAAKARRKEESAAPPPAVAEPAVSISENPRIAFIGKARKLAAEYTQGLPSYICQEVATRYVSQTHVVNWTVVDIVTAEVVYDDHKETYRNIAINGKATKKSPEETGSWSTGEFGTIQADLFSPGVADFKFAHDSMTARIASSVYDFDVPRARSSWKVRLPGQFINPAYKGSVWLDKQKANVLRIEMQGRDIPEEFPLVSVETTVDYDYISLGTPAKFLLPVRAEVLTCRRGSNECERNVIEFRNYHKFAGESTIKFNQ
ncbi:MAG TPA: hypothetical protein VIX89_12325 [Bryobacteraceae bacterium]